MATSVNSPETFASDFERVRPALAGASLPWLEQLRRSALTSLAESGFPSVRDEDWKYTNVTPALRERLEPVLPSESRAEDGRALLARAVGVERGESTLVFVDGVFQPSLSHLAQPKGLKLTSLRAKLEADGPLIRPWLGKFLPASAHAFTALNTAFLDDGAVVEISEGAAVEVVVHLVYLATSRERPYAIHPRNVILAGAGSSSRIVEHYVGAADARYLCNAATEVFLDRSASLAHVRIQDESVSASHIARVQVDQEAGSSYRSLALAFGAQLSRVEIAVRLSGEEAECDFAGLYAIDGSRHVDHHLMIDHAQPKTRSNQLYKGVLEDSSRGVFTGRVVVRAGSQKIKAMQSNPSLLLGRGAVAETRPQLEIYADDVACNHGATIGRLDDDALFYLLSRGITPHDARRILVSGFAAEVIENVQPVALREALLARVSERIGELGQEGRASGSSAGPARAGSSAGTGGAA
jgi:Fe-S cluster assembly protein SufD